MDIFKELRRIAEYNASEHGVSLDSVHTEGQIIATGVSKKSGKPTLAVPALMGIFMWKNGELLPSTMCSYFVNPIANLEGTSIEKFKERLSITLKHHQSAEGYYLVNHINKRYRFIDQDWSAVCQKLNGKYMNSDTDTVISDKPVNNRQALASLMMRQGEPIEEEW